MLPSPTFFLNFFFTCFGSSDTLAPPALRRLLLLSLEWPSTLNPCKQKELTGAEAEMIAGFSCLKAQCYKPSDRAMLLRKIREQWDSEQEFDRFVQTELVRVIAESKAIYQGQLRANAVQSFEYVFGD